MKIAKSYRLSKATLDRINWLVENIGFGCATDVIEECVSVIYNRERECILKDIVNPLGFTADDFK